MQAILSNMEDMEITINYNEKLERVKRNPKMLEILPTHIVRENHCYQITSGLLLPVRSNYRVLNEINDLLYTFLWNGKGDKIKQRVMINDFGAGGLKMMDIISFNKSLKNHMD